MQIGTLTATDVAADEKVFLIGRPPMGEFLGFVTTQTIEGRTADLGALSGVWRTANDHVQQLEQDEIGLADNVGVGVLPAAVLPLRDEVLASPIVRASFAITPVEIAMVELDRLVVFQKHVNLNYVRELRNLLGDAPTDEALFRFCLPFDQRFDPPAHIAQFAPNAWAFVSPSNDLRVLDTVLLEPSQVVGVTAKGVATAMVALVVGYGSNYLNAIRAEGRLVLNNGSHRAYALREAGLTHAPCLIQHVSRREELEVIGNEELNTRADLYLKAQRPPLLKDYFDPELRMIVHVSRTVRQLRVALQSEQMDVPAA